VRAQVRPQVPVRVLVLVRVRVLAQEPGQVLVLVPVRVQERVLAQVPPREQAWPLLPQELGWISWRAEWRGQEYLPPQWVFQEG